MALTVEAAELAEIFMWLHSDDANNVKESAEEYQHLQEELADVFWYVCRLCEHFDVDLAKAVEEGFSVCIMGLNPSPFRRNL